MDVRLDGARYHVTVHGAGLPLVLLHGFTGSHESWAPHFDAWRERYTCIAPDALGHGLSSAPASPARYAVERAADDVVALLDRLALPTAIVLGYSMGGRIALATAVRHPQLVAALVVESGSPGLAGAAARAARAATDAALADRIEREGVPAFVAHWERLPLFATQAGVSETACARVRRIRLGHTAVGLANSLRGGSTGAQPSYWSALPGLSMPVCLVAGEYDDKFREIAEAMAAALPRAELRVVPGAGHWVDLERPAAFRAAVDDFLADHGAPALGRGEHLETRGATS